MKQAFSFDNSAVSLYLAAWNGKTRVFSHSFCVTFQSSILVCNLEELLKLILALEFCCSVQILQLICIYIKMFHAEFGTICTKVVSIHYLLVLEPRCFFSTKNNAFVWYFSCIVSSSSCFPVCSFCNFLIFWIEMYNTHHSPPYLIIVFYLLIKQTSLAVITWDSIKILLVQCFNVAHIQSVHLWNTKRILIQPYQSEQNFLFGSVSIDVSNSAGWRDVHEPGGNENYSKLHM